ncbi:hypothetical protein NP233_g2254 [Leucocoprinus birnbaumii]|uniref:Uncharacterized protein n=1 Tax=Leucocoprinus birnbaumii TaxID=56174 RepID=A0AAD5VZA7_9AGAR|nr:hypothetical protein NP233_g2254 [Leucocoprinus birnbaumii]
MPLKPVRVQLEIKFPEQEQHAGYSLTFPRVSFGSVSILDVFAAPISYCGSILFEITLTFDEADDLSFPTTHPLNLPKPSSQSSNPIRKALCHSLNDPCFVDVKFYLYSGRREGRPAHPKVVYANWALLCENNEYMKNLLSPAAGSASGTVCELHDDVPEEIAKLSPDTFDYDSDSDLEDEDEDAAAPATILNGREATSAQGIQGTGDNTNPDGAQEKGVRKAPTCVHACRAYAINGTAHKTWSALVMYLYTNDIGTMEFSALSSQRMIADRDLSHSETVSCSPKSMYRLADYIGLSSVKSLSKEKIRQSLSESNIVTELFSTFTYRYQEIIEMEVEFLLTHLTSQVRRELNELLRLIVLGRKPHCFKVLSFTMSRMLGDDIKEAWSLLLPEDRADEELDNEMKAVGKHRKNYDNVKGAPRPPLLP